MRTVGEQLAHDSDLRRVEKIPRISDRSHNVPARQDEEGWQREKELAYTKALCCGACVCFFLLPRPDEDDEDEEAALEFVAASSGTSKRAGGSRRAFTVHSSVNARGLASIVSFSTAMEVVGVRLLADVQRKRGTSAECGSSASRLHSAGTETCSDLRLL